MATRLIHQSTKENNSIQSRRQFLKYLSATGITTMLPQANAQKMPHASQVLHIGPTKHTTPYPNWLFEARILGLSVSGLKLDPVTFSLGLDSAIEQGANVIEADSRLSDYLPDKDFKVEIELITDVAKAIHERGLKVVWYIPALEVITPNGRTRKDSFGRQHVDWLQLSFDRQWRGIFYGQRVFWVEPNDESAWTCPNSPYREWYIERLRQLAGTGIDAIWIDVPLFGLVVAKWGCACPYCRKKFAEQTGMEFPDKFDISDERFWRFVRWRHQTLTEFMDDCRDAIIDVNPKAVSIAEVVGLDHIGATEWGTEGSDLSKHFIIWEQDGISETTAMANGSYDDWIAQYASYKYCRGATQDKPSWAFCYGFEETDAQLVMAAAIAAQNNPYELRVPKMTTTVGEEFRGMMYNWIARHSKQIFLSQSLAQVAIIYSARNRDFLDAIYSGGMVISQSNQYRDRRWLGSRLRSPINHEYMGDYRGLSLLLYQHQIPTDIIQISRVGPESLARYPVLVLPYMAMLDESEQALLLGAVKQGATLIISGPEPGYWTADGNRRKNSLWANVINEFDGTTPKSQNLIKGRLICWRREIGRDYLRTHDTELTRQLLSWLGEAGVFPWVTEKKNVIVQPYRYQNEMIIHILNYAWVGALKNKPHPVSLELTIPRDPGRRIKKIIQSEPQWQNLKYPEFSHNDKSLIVSLQCGINSLLRIEFV